MHANEPEMASRWEKEEKDKKKRKADAEQRHKK
jgi:hypothetical protein